MTGTTNLDKLLNFGEEDETSNTVTEKDNKWFSFKGQEPSPDETKDYTFRILPPNEGSDEPFVKARTHYFTVNGKRVTTAIRGTSPASNLFFKTINLAKQTEDKALIASVRRLNARERYYFNVVNRETGDIQILGLPKTGYTFVMNALKSAAKYGMDATDPNTGRDVILTLTGNTDVGFGSFTYTGANLAPVESEIGVEGWEENMHDLEAAAFATVLEDDVIEEMIPAVLGDHYEPVMELLS